MWGSDQYQLCYEIWEKLEEFVISKENSALIGLAQAPNLLNLWRRSSSTSKCCRYWFDSCDNTLSLRGRDANYLNSVFFEHNCESSSYSKTKFYFFSRSNVWRYQRWRRKCGRSWSEVIISIGMKFATNIPENFLQE